MVFGRFFTRSPLHDPREKAWVESRMQWLSEQFGVDVLRNAKVLLPTEEHFPEPFTGQREDAERVLKRLCQQLQIQPEGIELRFEAAEKVSPHVRRGGHAAATWHEEDGGTVITLVESVLTDPEKLLATLAHELSHHRLLGEKRMIREEWDHADLEDVTDLTPVYFGAGVFAANATIRDQYGGSALMEFWSISRMGYLPARLFGYAFALFAWLRNEASPAWAAHLRRDAREVFESGLKYLRKTQDSLFRPETAGREVPPPTLADLEDTLQHGTPGRRVDALWQLGERGAEAQPLLPAILDAARDKHPSLRDVALETLSQLELKHADIQDEAQFRLTDPEPSVRMTAAFILPKVAVNPTTAIEELTVALNDPSFRVNAYAAGALAAFGELARDACPAMAKPLKRALVHGEAAVTGSLLHALLTIHPDADAFIAEQITDAELFREAREMLTELRGEPAEG